MERYREPLRSAYNKVKKGLNRDFSDKEFLYMAILAVNETIGPEGLCPKLVVYVIILRRAWRTPSTTRMARIETIEVTKAEESKIHEHMQISFGLRRTGSPKALLEQSIELGRLPASSPVLTYHTTRKMWEVPHTFVGVEGETAINQTGGGLCIIRPTCVNPYAQSIMRNHSELEQQPGKGNEEENT